MANKFSKIGTAMRKSHELTTKAKKFWDQAKELIGNPGFCCYQSWHETNGTPVYQIEIPLAEFLTTFPSVKPTKTYHEWQGNGLERFKYGPTLAASEADVVVWVEAYTEAIKTPLPVKADEAKPTGEPTAA